MQTKEAIEHIISRLSKELPSNLYYHQVGHTLDVLKAAERIANLEGVTAHEMILIRTAAAYHDCGYLVKYGNSEADSVQITRNKLPTFGYTAKDIDIICRMISCTTIPCSLSSRYKHMDIIKKSSRPR